MADTGVALQVAAAITPPLIAITQIAKWAGMPSKFAPLAVVTFAALICAIWAYSEGPPSFGAMLFQYLVATLAATVQALGLYAFVTAKVFPPDAPPLS